MAYTILNEADSFSPNQSELDSVDIDVLVAGFSGNGVISGGAVTAQGTPDMTVAVAAGVSVISNSRVVIGAGNVTITTADGTNPRIDLVVINSSAVKSVTAGTAAAQPVLPSIPANSIVLATLYVEASDTSIETNKINDRRVINAIPVAQLANGTDGELITWDASGLPSTVPVGTVNYALVSGGTGVAPTFQVVPVAGGGTGVATSTGTGSVVLNTSPTLVTPALGTPASGVMTNVTGTAASLTAGNVTTNANLTGHVTSVGNAAVLGSFTTAQLLAAVTGETGTGAVVFGTSPTLITPALGTPASGVMTSVTGTAAGLTAGNVTTNANLTGIVTSTGNATAIAAKAIAIAKLADGTDGELITWDASGVIATVAVGTSGHVLTSGGSGVAPTFQASASSGASESFAIAMAVAL
jgi:hypothetical protein